MKRKNEAYRTANKLRYARDQVERLRTTLADLGPIDLDGPATEPCARAWADVGEAAFDLWLALDGLIDRVDPPSPIFSEH